MNRTRANQLVLLSAMMVFGLTYIHSYLPDLKRGKEPKFPPLQLFIAIGITYMIIGAMADFAPGFAAVFSILLMTTTLFYEGADVIDWLTGVDKNLNRKKATNVGPGGYRPPGERPH